MPRPCRSPAMPCINSHMTCRAPALLRQCRVLRGCPHGNRKYPTASPQCNSSSFFFCSVLLPLFPRPWQTVFGFTLASWIWNWYASDHNFVELRVVAGRTRMRASSPHPRSWRPCCAVALRRRAWSGMAWARRGKCESDTAAMCQSNGKDTF